MNSSKFLLTLALLTFGISASAHAQSCSITDGHSAFNIGEVAHFGDLAVRNDREENSVYMVVSVKAPGVRTTLHLANNDSFRMIICDKEITFTYTNGTLKVSAF